MAGTEGKDLRELKELVEFLKANGIAEFEMERPDLKVGLRFAGETPAAATGIDPAQMAALLTNYGSCAGGSRSRGTRPCCGCCGA
jgi:acetyl-CoA carboxylase biotin carboxyl carrier protein